MDIRKLFVFAYMLVVVIMVALIANATTGKNKPQVLDFDQFDSLCVADSIPRNLNTWEKYDTYDEINDRVVTTYTLDKGDSVSYEVTFGDDGDFNVLKNKK